MAMDEKRKGRTPEAAREKLRATKHEGHREDYLLTLHFPGGADWGFYFTATARTCR